MARAKLSSSHHRGPRAGAPTGKDEKPSSLRCGTVAIVGKPNVGKSTLVNALIGFRLSITTPKPQTTRDRILGVLTRGSAQLVFLDTPGLHHARNTLGAQMNLQAEEAARSADVVIYVVELPARGRGELDPERDETLKRVLSAAGDKTPIILAVNKTDRVKEKKQLLGVLQRYAKIHPFAAFVPITAARGGEGNADGLDRLLDEVAQLLPEGPFLFPEDEITDRPERFLAAEQVREAVIMQTRDEIPYAIAITIDEWEEPASAKSVTRIEATIHVDKDAQRKIVVGHSGERIKSIGIAARKSIEATLGRRVHLGLYVKVDPAWANDERKLAELGYEPPRS
jgi:GTP-binding protein Era